jgi:hypothetical protein
MDAADASLRAIDSDELNNSSNPIREDSNSSILHSDPIAFNKQNFRARLSALSLNPSNVIKPDISIDREPIHAEEIEAECVQECCNVILQNNYKVNNPILKDAIRIVLEKYGIIKGEKFTTIFRNVFGFLRLKDTSHQGRLNSLAYSGMFTQIEGTENFAAMRVDVKRVANALRIHDTKSLKRAGISEG